MTNRFRTTLAFAVLALCLPLSPSLLAQEAATDAQSSDLATEDAKMLYTIGLMISQNLGTLGLDEAELEIVGRGMADSILGRELQVDMQEYGPKLQGYAMARMTAIAEKEKEKSAPFVAAAAAEPGAETTESGLVYTEITAGTGASPAAGDKVRVHYHGKLRDGKVFDSSVDRGEPAEFLLNQVIACWTEGVQKMKVGGKSRLVCPSEIAYGDQGRPGIPGGAALDFEVELLGIVELEAGS